MFEVENSEVQELLNDIIELHKDIYTYRSWTSCVDKLARKYKFGNFIVYHKYDSKTGQVCLAYGKKTVLNCEDDLYQIFRGSWSTSLTDGDKERIYKILLKEKEDLELECTEKGVEKSIKKEKKDNPELSNLHKELEEPCKRKYEHAAESYDCRRKYKHSTRNREYDSRTDCNLGFECVVSCIIIGVAWFLSGSLLIGLGVVMLLLFILLICGVKSFSQIRVALFGK
jgi:hypothetical protein